MVKVSILVPVYNVEKFLAQCLDSLICQTLKEIEIICINDGSTDNSLKILKKYAQKDDRIIIINKKNSGYGDSMNRGLKKATGEYIGIVESDDFIDRNAYEVLYGIAKKNDCDVVKSNFYEYYGEKEKDKRASSLFRQEDVDKVINPKCDRDIFYQPPSIWAAIYRRKFLEKEDIGFLPTAGASYQDTGFNFKVWAMAKRVYFTNQAFLHYRQDNAKSSVKDVRKINYIKQEYDNVQEYLKEQGVLQEMGTSLFIARCGGYVWNLHRLNFRAALVFARFAHEDYRVAKKMGFLKAKEMSEAGKYKKWVFAVRFPWFYILLRPIHNLRNNLRTIK